MQLQQAISAVKHLSSFAGVQSISISGSRPEKLGPGDDLDFIIVIGKDTYQNTLDNIDAHMRSVMQQNSGVQYSYINGPIRYEHDGLIHLLIYLDEAIEEPRSSITGERRSVMRSHANQCETLYGTPLAQYLPDTKGEEPDKKWILGTQQRLENEGFLHLRWAKINGRWQYVRILEPISRWQYEQVLSWLWKHSPE